MYFKTRIYNRIMLNGNKQTSEKLFFKTLKKIQKNQNKKKIEDLIKLGLVKSSPVTFLKQVKRKRKRTTEFPFLLHPNSRVAYGLKFILNNCQSTPTTRPFYKQLGLELVNSSKHLSKSVTKKVFLHQESFLKKKFANYRWF